MAFVGGGTLHGSGVNALFAVGLEETTWGTAASAEMWGGLCQNYSIKKLYDIHEHRGITNIRTMSNQVKKAHRVEGSITVDVDCGVPVAMGYGYISGTTDPTISLFKGVSHTTPTKDYMPSWSILLEYDEATDDNISALGAMIKTANYSLDLDGPFKATLDFVAKSAGTTALTGATNPATSLGSWNTTVSVKEGATTYSTGTAITGLKNVSWSINNNLRVRNEWNDATAIRQPIAGPADIELRLTRGFIDDDFWDDLIDGTVQSFEVKPTDGTTTLTFEFDSCFSKEGTHNVNLTDQSDEVAVFSVKDSNCVVADAVTYVSWD